MRRSHEGLRGIIKDHYLNLPKELEEFKSNVKVTIMQGLPKADKIELIIQKSVELRSI